MPHLPFDFPGLLRPSRAAVALAALLALAPAARAQAPDAEAQFKKSCMSCHSIGGGKKTGPDLSGVLKRRDRAWVEKFIQTPDAMLTSDTTAMALLAENANTKMPNLGITPEEAAGLIKLIEEATASGRVIGKPVAARPITPEDIALGRALFSGKTRLAGGGPACFSCHTASGIARWGGGRLGPDLTGATARLGPGLADAIASPAWPTMRPVFGAKPITSDEAFQLTAYLKSVEAQPVRPRDPLLPVAGGLGLALGILLTGFFGRNRLRGVRSQLIARA
jgi:cytochrome c2